MTILNFQLLSCSEFQNYFFYQYLIAVEGLAEKGAMRYRDGIDDIWHCDTTEEMLLFHKFNKASQMYDVIKLYKFIFPKTI